MAAALGILSGSGLCFATQTTLAGNGWDALPPAQPDDAANLKPWEMDWSHDWLVFGESSTGSEWMVRGIKLGGGAVGSELWVKIDHSHDRTTKARISMALLWIDCDDRKIGQRSFVEYAPNGAVLSSSDDEHPQMSPAVPESMGEALLEVVCKKGETSVSLSPARP